MIGFEAASVSELVASIKTTLEEQYHEVMVQGEVTNLSPSASGHWYFTLSDENAAISCALFKGDALRNPLIRNLKDGDKLIVAGPLSVFQKRGSFQILAKKILPAGAGQLKMQYERLKARLSQEGLFDLEKKKPLPLFPKKIAVITAEHGAALQDFLNVIKRRSLWFEIVIIPALVQGETAPRSLVGALQKAQSLTGVDVIVLTRGGGSLEDLWAFNDEELVREIHRCAIPVVSAVGHQVDFSLCDYVADFRSETPTAAAEILSQAQMDLSARLHYCVSHLSSTLHREKQNVELLKERFHPKELFSLIYKKWQDSVLSLSRIRLQDRSEELIGHREASQKLDECFIRLNHGIKTLLFSKTEQVKRFEHVLSALNPKNVLERGYCFVKIRGGEVLSSLQQYSKIEAGSVIELHFHDGNGVTTKE